MRSEREHSLKSVPSVNIGSRQKDRLRGKNIIDSSYDYNELKKKILLQVSKKSFKSEKIYGDGNSGKKITSIIKI